MASAGNWPMKKSSIAPGQRVPFCQQPDRRDDWHLQPSGPAEVLPQLP